MKLIEYITKHDIKLYISDIDRDKIDFCVSKYGAIAVSENDIYDLDVDIYSPCAIGATINDNTIDRINCKIIAGAANNVLKDYKKHGEMLFQKNILYAPDYVINAGGVINIYNEIGDYNKDDVFHQTEKIYDSLMNIFNESVNQNKPTNIISDYLAEKIINENKKNKLIFQNG